MKKVLLAGSFAVLGMVALSSCKKDYTCKDTDGDEISTCTGCTGTQKEAFETTCTLAGGTVSNK